MYIHTFWPGIQYSVQNSSLKFSRFMLWNECKLEYFDTTFWVSGSSRINVEVELIYFANSNLPSVILPSNIFLYYASWDCKTASGLTNSCLCPPWKTLRLKRRRRTNEYLDTKGSILHCNVCIMLIETSYSTTIPSSL